MFILKQDMEVAKQIQSNISKRIEETGVDILYYKSKRKILLSKNEKFKFMP